MSKAHSEWTHEMDEVLISYINDVVDEKKIKLDQLTEIGSEKLFFFKDDISPSVFADLQSGENGSNSSAASAATAASAAIAVSAATAATAAGETKTTDPKKIATTTNSDVPLHVFSESDQRITCQNCEEHEMVPFDFATCVSQVVNCGVCQIQFAEDVGTFRCPAEDCEEAGVCNQCWSKHQSRFLVKCPHNHSLIPVGTTEGGEWNCDGRSLPNRCVRGITEWDDTNNVPRFRCHQCDYDLCDGCIDRAAAATTGSGKSPAAVANLIDLKKLPRTIRTLVAMCFGTRWIRQRFKILRRFNQMIHAAIPMIDLNLVDVVGSKLGASHSWSVAQCMSSCRHLVFSVVKVPLWKRAVTATMGSSSGPFNLRLHRPRAFKLRRENAMTGKVDQKFTISMFSQFFKHVRTSSSTITIKNLRRHEKLYDVKFIGENAQDAGGPYRESWQDFATEMMSQCIPLFLPVPNEQDSTSANRDQWLPNPNPSGSDDNDGMSPLHYDAFLFCGQLLGIAMRNELCLPLNFASIVWKALSNDTLTMEDIYQVDSSTRSIVNGIRSFDVEKNGKDGFLEIDLMFSCETLNGQQIDLIENGSTIQVTCDRREEYCTLLEEYRLHEFDTQLEVLRKGLSMIVPIKPLTLFTWSEVATLVTGRPGKMNLTLLKKHTDFKRWQGNEQTILWLWELLEEMEPEDQAAFLKFTWGRTRLPLSSETFTQKMKLTQRSSSPDAFPISHTCFFEIEIPVYTSKEIMREKIMYAIIHCTSIDGDGNSASAEGWEDMEEVS